MALDRSTDGSAVTRPDGPVEDIVDAVVSYLRARHAEETAVALFLDRLGSAGSPLGKPAAPRHGTELTRALAELCQAEDEALAEVGRRVSDAAASLPWRVDDGQYYATQAPVGEGYRHGNMHAVLAEGDDFAMGLFMLVPGVDYLDHRHQAPEFYLNLTGPSTWRFNFGEWVEFPAGSVVWNGPGQVHATRSGQSPWLSVWAWLSDVEQLCEVVYDNGHR